MKCPQRREYYGPVARHPGGRPVGLRDSEAEYGGADMFSTANGGGPSGTPDGTRPCLTGAPCTVGRAHVWAVTGQRVRIQMSDLILIGE